MYTPRTDGALTIQWQDARKEHDMDPNFSVWLTQQHTTRHDDGLERELVVYRTDTDRLSHRMIVATRHHLATLFFAIGERLESKSEHVEPAATTRPT